jgi:hypothetical protein
MSFIPSNILVKKEGNPVNRLANVVILLVYGGEMPHTDKRKAHKPQMLTRLSVRPLPIWFPEHNVCFIWPTIFKHHRVIVRNG